MLLLSSHQSDDWTLVVETDVRGRYYRASFNSINDDDDVTDVRHSKLGHRHHHAVQLVIQSLSSIVLPDTKRLCCLPNGCSRESTFSAPFSCHDGLDLMHSVGRRHRSTEIYISASCCCEYGIFYILLTVINLRNFNERKSCSIAEGFWCYLLSYIQRHR